MAQLINFALISSALSVVFVATVKNRAHTKIKMHDDAAIRSLWIELLERRAESQSCIATLLAQLGANSEADHAILERLVVAIVEWRQISQALALASVSGGIGADAERCALAGESDFCVELWQIARLCFEFAAAVDDGAASDEFNRRQCTRYFSGSRLAAVATEKRFEFAPCARLFAAAKGFGHAESDGGARVGDGAERGGRDTRGGEADGSEEETIFYDASVDSDTVNDYDDGCEQKLCAIYASAIERAESASDDINRTLLGRVEHGAREADGARGSGCGARVEAANEIGAQRVSAKTQHDAVAAREVAAIRQQSRRAAGATHRARAHRGVFGHTAALRSEKENAALAMRS